MESWDLGAAPNFQHYRGVEGHARSPRIRLGRGTRLSSLNLHPKPTTKGLVHIREHPWVLGQATGSLTHKTHHDPDSGGATTILPIVLFLPLRRTCTRMALFPETPKVESQNCPGFGLPRLWDIIASRPNLRPGRGLNQTCSPLRELSNVVSHSPSARWEQVDFRLLVVGLLPITWAADVQMTNVRPFRTSTLQDLSHDTKNTPRRGVLPLAVEL